MGGSLDVLGSIVLNEKKWKQSFSIAKMVFNGAQRYCFYYNSIIRINIYEHVFINVAYYFLNVWGAFRNNMVWLALRKKN